MFRLSLLLTLTSTLTAPAFEAAPSSGQTGPTAELDVLVSLAMPAGASPRALDDWTATIAELQRELLDCADVPSHGVIRRFAWIPMLQLRVDARVVEAMERCPAVRAVGVNGTNRPQLSESLPLIDAFQAYNSGPTGSGDGWTGAGTTVAIVDTGVDLTPPELGGCIGPSCKIVAGLDFADQDGTPDDCDGHGTALAAIAAGSQGVAPNARIAALKVYPDTDCGIASDADVAAALEWVVQNASSLDVRAVLLGFSRPGPRYSVACDSVVAYTAAVDAVVAAGVAVLAPTGNDGDPDAISYPACLSTVIGVAASYDTAAGAVDQCLDTACSASCSDVVTQPDTIVCSSNGGALVDVAAPGSAIFAAGMSLSGTSAAAAHAAGVTLLMAQLCPAVDPTCVRDSLSASSPSVPDPRGAGYVYPRVHAPDALAALASCGCETCDGKDNDGSGGIDEPFVNPATGGKGLGDDCTDGTGACASNGEYDCRENALGIECDAEPKPPFPIEYCNYEDDDCDGETDEGYEELDDPCISGVGLCAAEGVNVCGATGTVVCGAEPYPAQPELCDGLDNDCDGQTDEDWPEKGTVCFVGVGLCMNVGSYVCASDGGGLACNEEPHLASLTDPCDGLDNNCNGATDEDFPELGQQCTVGEGACANEGTYVCRPDGLDTKCLAEPLLPEVEVCDGVDNNCNGITDDGFDVGAECAVGIGACQDVGTVVCTPTGQTACDAQGKPPSPETCDGIDNDCDGWTDELWQAELGTPCTAGEGTCVADGITVCRTDGSGVTCNAVPGTPSDETCNGLDDDCDGATDEDFTDLGDSCTYFYPDGGVTSDCAVASSMACAPGSSGTECGKPVKSEFDQDGDGWSVCGGDCNDLNPDVHIDAIEDLDNHIDDNCDNRVDEGSDHYDDDYDGWTEVDGDCDDSNSHTYPGAWELPDGRDNDCDGVIDDADGDFDGWSVADGDCDDQDGDTYPNAWELPDGRDNDCDGTIDDEDGDFDGWTVADGDCDDQDGDTYPNAWELPDGRDNDCDGTIDDEDGDFDGWTVADGDCDDQDGDTYPGAWELPNGRDNDCDGSVLDVDADFDGWSVADEDCDDTDPTIYPGAPELDDGKDNDCDGNVPEALGGLDCAGAGGQTPHDLALVLLALGLVIVRCRFRAGLVVVALAALTGGAMDAYAAAPSGGAAEAGDWKKDSDGDGVPDTADRCPDWGAVFGADGKVSGIDTPWLRLSEADFRGLTGCPFFTWEKQAIPRNVVNAIKQLRKGTHTLEMVVDGMDDPNFEDRDRAAAMAALGTSAKSSDLEHFAQSIRDVRIGRRMSQATQALARRFRHRELRRPIGVRRGVIRTGDASDKSGTIVVFVRMEAPKDPEQVLRRGPPDPADDERYEMIRERVDDLADALKKTMADLKAAHDDLSKVDNSVAELRRKPELQLGFGLGAAYVVDQAAPTVSLDGLWAPGKAELSWGLRFAVGVDALPSPIRVCPAKGCGVGAQDSSSLTAALPWIELGARGSQVLTGHTSLYFGLGARTEIPLFLGGTIELGVTLGAGTTQHAQVDLGIAVRFGGSLRELPDPEVMASPWLRVAAQLAVRFPVM